jgi:hypothetical protein
MPILHAIHRVLAALLILSNLLLIPVVAAFGTFLGTLVADAYSLVETERSTVVVLGGIMAVGVINGSLSIIILARRSEKVRTTRPAMQSPKLVSTLPPNKTAKKKSKRRRLK